MSDEKRNMNDINDQKTAEQQAFSEEIRRRLAEPGSGKPTLDEFKVMVYKDREKRLKKRNALVACIVAAFIVGYLTYDDLVPEVGADKNPKETIVTEDGVIIEDGGWGSSNVEENIFLVEEWENISDAKYIVPGLLVPKYVPEGYDFVYLKIEKVVANDAICEYIFKNDKGNIIEIEILTIEGGETSSNIENVSKTIELENTKIYIQEEEKKATVFIEGGITISMWSMLHEDEIKKVFEHMKN